MRLNSISCSVSYSILSKFHMSRNFSLLHNLSVKLVCHNPTFLPLSFKWRNNPPPMLKEGKGSYKIHPSQKGFPLRTFFCNIDKDLLQKI
ncbi:MAG: hypothetical protein A2Y81_00470 [Nitrospirae bacterium RBG_13_43_8]|nr:MAG: hypothetical protein A2Y81_00470 [Nitrospirae bacterium RBG_13_43_8]